MTRSQLAATLFISANTVKFHARGLYRKLHATNRQEAVSRARALGLLDDPGTGD
jgi:LuxR family maltose regulon positive regulatory protein